MKRRLRPAATLVVALAVLAPIAAVASDSPWLLGLILLADLALLAALYSGVADRRNRVRVVRSHSASVPQGRPFSIETRVTNEGPKAVRVRIIHRLPESFEPREHHEEVRVPAGGSVDVRFRAAPEKRGSHPLPPPYVELATWAGLGWRSQAAEAPSAIDVLPDLALLGRFDALVRQRRLVEMGVVATRQRGEGTEIVGLRPYVRGDAFNRLDWKATARHGSPVSREMAAERRQDVLLVLDCGRRMAREACGKSRLDLAIEAALLLAHVAVRADDRVGLAAFADTVHRAIKPGRGVAHARAITKAAFALEPTLREPPYQAIAGRISRLVRRRALLVLFTDAAEPVSLERLATAFRVLTRRHLVLCVVFRDLAVEAALREKPTSGESLFRAGAAAELAMERAAALRALRRSGALVLESAAAELPAAVVNRYLEVKARRLL